MFGLLVLLIVTTVQVFQGLVGLVLHLVQVDQGSCLVVLHLGGSIGLQGAGMAAWGQTKGLLDLNWLWKRYTAKVRPALVLLWILLLADYN